MQIEWTVEEIDTLTYYWSSLSAREIGDKLGKSKNAVIGKARRLNLPIKKDTPAVKMGRPVGSCTLNRPTVTRAQKRPVLVGREKIVPSGPPPIVSVPGGIHIMDLDEHHCRAIVCRGDDGLSRYCGAQKAVRPCIGPNGLRDENTIAWCEGHAAIYLLRE